MPTFANTKNLISRLENRPTSPVISAALGLNLPDHFLSHLGALLDVIPANSNILNICRNRLFFCLGFCAGIVKNSPNLLPQNKLTTTLVSLLQENANAVLLADAPLEDDLQKRLIELSIPVIRLDNLISTVDTQRSTPPISLTSNEQQKAATVFTSGSTGQPKALNKTWGQLSGTALKLHERFQCDQWQGPIIATVPSQHMYGLEMAITLALSTQLSVVDITPFFPTDIADAFRQYPHANLVTTPFHLKNAYKHLKAYSIDRIICATAPLDKALAIDVENVLNTQVHEILGCSEAGSFATRRTVKTDEWTLLKGFEIWQSSGEFWIQSDHLKEPTRLEDQLELTGETTFKLLGRSTDMLNVAGKRSSISELTHQILAIPGVEDAAVFVPKKNNSHDRPAALIVSQLSKTHILQSLAERIDPIFMPRPLKLVAKIPRNDTGKLVKSELEQAL